MTQRGTGKRRVRPKAWRVRAASRVRRPVKGRKSTPKLRGEKSRVRAQVAVVVSQFAGDLGAMFDLRALVDGIKANRLVAMVAVQPYPVSRHDLGGIGSAIARRGLERVVVAGCSERLFGRLFRDCLAAFGIDPEMVEFANIVEHIGRGGARRQDATLSSIDLINVAVARLAGSRAMSEIEADIKAACVVIGGGVAGMAAATAVAARGIDVTVVEKRDHLGGYLNELNVIFPAYIPAAEFLSKQVEDLERAGVRVLAGTEPVAVKGCVGAFEVDLSDGTTLEVGTIIVATGADLLKPVGLYGYGERDAVVTQLELEGLLLDERDPGSNIIMVQCAGSRNDERPYCSRICCTASIKNTILIKQHFPKAKITVLSRGFAQYAGDLDRAREMGVEIIRYSPERPPVVGDAAVEVYDEISEMESHIPYDLVVLAVPMIPSASAAKLAKMLRIPTDQYGFLVEPHLKVRPEEYAPRGIFVAGCSHWPSTVTEAMVQGYGAASRAFDLMSKGTVMRRSFVTEIDRELCRGCGRCEEACQHGAISLSVGEDGLRQADVIPIQCTGCGVCVPVCPSGALTLADMSSEQTEMTVEALRGA